MQYACNDMITSAFESTFHAFMMHFTIFQCVVVNYSSFIVITYLRIIIIRHQTALFLCISLF